MTQRLSDLTEIEIHECRECGIRGPWVADKHGERYCAECA